MRWVKRIIGLGVLGLAAFWAYGFHRAGYWTLPELPDGAYTLSFKSGLRAIILDADVSDDSWDDYPKYARSLSFANPDRNYLGFAFDVEPWFADAWSWCKAPSAEDKARLQRSSEDFRRRVENARFEAVCRINVDGKEIERGLIFSVPKL